MEAQATIFMPIQAQPVVVSPPANRTHLPTVRGLAVTQLLVGIAAIIFGIASVGSLNQRYWLTNVGGGIWAGVFIMVTGVIGISSSRNLSSSGLNRIYMGFSIICSVVAFFVGILFIVGVTHYSSCKYSRYYQMNDYYPRRGWDCYLERGRGLGLYIPLMILMIIEFFVSIIAAVYACKNSNCCYAQQTQSVIFTQQYQMVTSSQGQTIVYPVASCPAVSYNAAGYVPTHSTVPSQGYPQQMGIVTYPSQMVSQPPYGGIYIPTQGQNVSSQTNIAYSTQPPPYTQGQHTPAQTNIAYSTQPPAYNMVPPPYNDTPPLETRN